MSEVGTSTLWLYRWSLIYVLRLSCLTIVEYRICPHHGDIWDYLTSLYRPWLKVRRIAPYYRMLFLLLHPRQGCLPSLDVPCNQVCISDRWYHNERNSITLPSVIFGAYRLNHGVIKQAKGKNNSSWNRILILNKVTPSSRTWIMPTGAYFGI